ncbi:MAG: LysM peptidoglycan-binding domain-containing protein [Defluviitaleaceae bacterium]|nr:LysM peptidoglycan-binding domain-containing protein [Defluviitaleaceae bacterium]MCL2262026.1 LysM peptidoglycan-binding domain-containing protein [Defluviitaleaceae bacterium]
MSKKTYDTDYPEEKQDTYYSEELSRAAVGRLFVEDEEDEDGPPPIKRAYVTGFDSAPSRDRQDRQDKQQTKKRERPSREAREPREEHDKFRPRREEEAPREENSHDEAHVERHRRREHATTRLLGGGSAIAAQEENPDNERREPRDRNGRRRNPSPKPAVRVNVPKERRVQEDQQEHAGDPNEPHPSPDDLETFRRRYNSGELFSPPRNPNRPTRKDRNDVRTNRARSNDRDAETINPILVILSVAAILVLVIVSVLAFQLISMRGNFGEAEDRIAELEAQLTSQQAQHSSAMETLQNTATAQQTENANLRSILTELGIDPDHPPEADETSRPGTDIPVVPPQPPEPEWPITHVIALGESISRIANRYFGNSSHATIEHIRATNNIANINNVQVGQVLTLTPME